MNEAFLSVAIGVYLVGIGTLCALVLHKVRRIHLMMFAVKTDVSRTRREVEVLYGQIESLEALNHLLRLEVPLPPLRGWAGSPDFLLAVVRHTRRVKPARVVECGSGASTIVLARSTQLMGRGHVFSLEHDRLYAARTRTELVLHGLEGWATVIDAPLAPCPVAGNQPWYSMDALPEDLSGVDMLVIDGPPLSTGPLARYPALPMLWAKLSPECMIFLDDADRSDEKVVVERWLKEYPSLRAATIPAEKGCVCLSRDRHADADPVIHSNQ